MLGLGGNQHLAVAQRLDVVGIGWSTAVPFLLWMSGLKLHRAGLVGDQRRARPQVILAFVSKCQQSTVSFRATATAAICWPRRARMRTKKACSGPGALAAAQAASTSMARA
ncbi:hypothetical protein XI08_09870 [Bradyrhizobium sp. CCBAU 11361]|nr:hypothetical protein [Bradyrhizobium sp. CCBAU 11361]